MTIRVQYVQGTVPNGTLQYELLAPASFLPLGSLSSAFILPATTYPTVGLGVEGGSTQQRNWALNCDINSTTRILLNRGNADGNTDFAFWIIEYVGPSGGPNEFIMRAKRIFNFAPDSAETTDSNPISGITNVNRTVPFINGRHENVGTAALRHFIASASFVDAGGGDWFAQLHRSLTTNGDPTYVVYAVEFTGSNWSVEHQFISFFTPGVNDDTPIAAITPGKAWLYGHFRAGDRDTPAGQTFFSWIEGNDIVRSRVIEVSNTSVFRFWVISNSDTRFAVATSNAVNGTDDIAAGANPALAQSQNLSIQSAQDNGTVVTGWLGSSATTTTVQPSGCWRVRRVPGTPDLVEVYRSRSSGGTEYVLQTITFPADATESATITPQTGQMTVSGKEVNGAFTRTPATAQLGLSQLGPFSEVFRTPGVGLIQLQGRQMITHAVFPITAALAWTNSVVGMQASKIIQIPVPAIDYDNKINAPPTIIIGTVMQPDPALLQLQSLQHASTEGGDIGFRSPATAVLSFDGQPSALALDTPDADLIVRLTIAGFEPTVIRQSGVTEPEIGQLIVSGGGVGLPARIFFPFQWIDVDPAPVVNWED